MTLALDKRHSSRPAWAAGIALAALMVVCAGGGVAWSQRRAPAPGTYRAAAGAHPTASLSLGAKSSASPGAPSGPGSPTAGPGGGHPSVGPTGTTSASAQAPGGAPPSSPAPPASTAPLGDGTYRAGADIAPGVWSTGGPVNVSLSCRYAVNGGTVKRVTLVGRTSVFLAGGDVLYTSGCKPWSWSP